MSFAIRNVDGQYFRKTRLDFVDAMSSATTWKSKGPIKAVIKARPYIFARCQPLEVVEMTIAEVGVVETITIPNALERNIVVSKVARQRTFRRVE